MKIFIISKNEEGKYINPRVIYDKKYDFVDLRRIKLKNIIKLILEIIIKLKIIISFLQLIMMSGIINIEIENIINRFFLNNSLINFILIV